jgi:hypothetical protein
VKEAAWAEKNVFLDLLLGNPGVGDVIASGGTNSDKPSLVFELRVNFKQPTPSAAVTSQLTWNSIMGTQCLRSRKDILHLVPS